LIELALENETDALANLQVAASVRSISHRDFTFVSKGAQRWDDEEYNSLFQDIKVTNKKFKNYILTIIAISFFIASVAFVFYYHSKTSDLNEQKAKIKKQLTELPDLEKDIFTKCMEDKGGTAKNIAFCQENTQKQMFTLAQDLNNAKNDIENKKWYQVLK